MSEQLEPISSVYKRFRSEQLAQIVDDTPEEERLPSWALGGRRPDWSQGLESVAMSCHPSQVEEFRAKAKAAGLTGVKYDDNGRCYTFSREQRKKAIRERGHEKGDFVDHDGGYGD